MNTQKVLVLKNYQMETLAKMISYPLPFQKGRVRNRFLKILQEKGDTLNNNRVDILKELSNKDEKQNPIMKDGVDAHGKPVKNYDLTPENLQKFNEEYTKLVQEDCLIDVLPSMEGDMGLIKNFIDMSPVEINATETEDVELIVSAFAELKKPAKNPQTEPKKKPKEK